MSDDPYGLLESTITDFLRDDASRDLSIAAGASLPPAARRDLDAVLRSSQLSYPGAALIQLAYAACGATDLTLRHTGARTVGQKLGEFLDREHIATARDAMQNVGKNSPNLVRGNFAEWDSLLKWLTAQAEAHGPSGEIETAFRYACAVVASSARPVWPLPEIDRSQLSYAATVGLLDDLLRDGSGGAMEQFVIAALLHGLVTQENAGLRVDTKHHNASDASSGSAADIEIFAGSRLVEAVEVTANDWAEKLPHASKIVRSHDLARLHIIGRVSSRSAAITRLRESAVEVTALDLGWCISIMVAVLNRQHRAATLLRLYELLDRKQPRVELVNRLVEALHSHGLVTR